MRKTLTVISANVCGNKAADNLSYPGNARIFDLACEKIVKKEAPDLLALEEIPYADLQFVQNRLRQVGYDMYINEEFHAEKRKGSFTCITVLFVKEDIKFEQKYRDGFETKYRYVAGVLTIGEQKIFLKVNHVPPVSDEGGRGSESEHIKEMLKRKTDFLTDELAYQQSLNEKQYAISMGDYNCAATGDFHAKEIFVQLPFVDLIDEPTWNSATLDHLFISRALWESGIPIMHKLISYPNLSDHKLLELIIEIG